MRIILYVLLILLSGCMGNQQTINKDTNNSSTIEPTRDRTPGVPRTNIPAHTF
jgi:hypothetical protein